MEKLFTRKEAAKILGVSIATLDTARNNGLISYVQYVQNGCVYLRMQASKSTSQNSHIGQSRWKSAPLTVKREALEREPIRILAWIKDVW